LRRNDVVFGGFLTSPNILFGRTQQSITEFQIVQGKREMIPLVLEDTRPICWSALDQEWVKANWDAALSQQRNRMGLAVVVCDHMGTMVVAGYQTRKGCPEPTTAKACAALMAIRKCKELGFTRVHFEGDAKVVVDAVLSEVEDRSRLGNVIEDIKEEIRTVPHWKFSLFVRRDANKAAHVLSKFAIQ
jgi:ribonuclease HI